MAFDDELAMLLLEVGRRVDLWTGEEAWTVEPGSPAALEMASAEVRADGTPWGDRPIRTVYQFAQMATKYTAELGRCVAALLAPDRPPPAVEVLTRSALEAASVAWWLLSDGLTARQRVCRMQLLRMNNAREVGRSIAAVGAVASAAAGESVQAVEQYGIDLGLSAFGQSGRELEGEVRSSYTDRVNALLVEWGYQGAYNIYSGSAHAELSGIWRLFQQTMSMIADRTPIYDPGPNPNATHAAVHGALLSMIAPMERIVLLFGWTAFGRAEEVGATIDHVNAEMTRLRP
jgi:hypothetical protein